MNTIRRRLIAALAATAGGARAHEPERAVDAALQQRLEIAEARLAQGDSAGALDGFESAASLSHSAEAELGVARALMQAGQYRRAAALAAHIAGVHLRETGGAAFYAWLLHLGGQSAAARSLLAHHRTLMPGDALLEAVTRLVLSDHAMPGPALLAPPVRLAPRAVGPTPAARVLASGVRLDDGSILAPNLGPARRRIWVRDHAGRTLAAEPRRNLADGAFTIWRPVGADEPPSGPLEWATRPPFPGSPIHCLAHVATPDGEPAWPRLRIGFLGTATTDRQRFTLGLVPAAGGAGGMVFDRSGTLVALMATGPVGAWQALAVAGLDLPATLAATAREPLPPEAIYERGLSRSVQVLADEQPAAQG